MQRLSGGFRIRIEYSSCTDQPGCNTKNNLTVESRIQKSYWEKNILIKNSIQIQELR